MKTMKKIAIKEANNYCIVKSNESLHIYETSCDTINNANKYFNMNTKTNQIILSNIKRRI